jgi:hypothetical protein
LVNGIEDFVGRPDLLERGIVLKLPAIPEEKRLPESGFWSRFRAQQPELLGALLDAAAGAQRLLPTVRLDRLPRMADFALWAIAAERGRGEEGFLAAYTDNRVGANELALDASPVVAPLQELLDKGEWSGTAAELLEALTARAGGTAARSREWPKSARSLSGRLRRLAPNLRAAGITVDFGKDGRGGGRRRVITIARAEEGRKQPSPPSPPPPGPENAGGNADGGDANNAVGAQVGTAGARLPSPTEALDSSGEAVAGGAGDGGDGRAQASSEPPPEREVLTL